MKRYKKVKRYRSILRAAGIIPAVIAVAIGITYAALQSQQNTLTGNTIETATASLMISADGTSYGNTHTGFDFANLIPGGSPMPTTGYPLYLKNTGGVAMSLKMYLGKAPTNPANVDLSKVDLVITEVGSGLPSQSFSLSSLLNAAQTGGLSFGTTNLALGAIQQYKIQATMDTDAVTGNSAALSGIDLVFVGAAVAN